MKNRCRSAQVIFGLAVLVIAAGRSVGMRVDVQTLAVVGELTTLVVSTEIAPEDRGRMGAQARMRLKLARGDTAVLHRLVDVDVDADGRARAEIQAPPGTYDLEIGLTAVLGDAAGFWRGTIAVPVVGEGDAPALQASPEPAAPSAKTGAEAPRTAAAAEPRRTPVGTAAAPAAGPEPTVAENAATAIQSPTTSAATAGPSVEPAPDFAPAAVDPARTIAVSPTPATVEPPGHELPGSAMAGSVVVETITTSPAARSAAGPTPLELSPQPAALGESPSPTAAPARGPAPSASTRPLVHDTPVRFLIALDVAEDNLGRASAIFEHFVRVAERGGLAAVEISPRPDATTSALSRLATALGTVAQPPDGTTLVLVTDGMRPQPRADWKSADTAILQTGAPLLAIGLWGDQFSAASRKNLGRIAVYSGGRLYLLQPGESTASVVSFFGLGE